MDEKTAQPRYIEWSYPGMDVWRVSLSAQRDDTVEVRWHMKTIVNDTGRGLWETQGRRGRWEQISPSVRLGRFRRDPAIADWQWKRWLGQGSLQMMPGPELEMALVAADADGKFYVVAEIEPFAQQGGSDEVGG